MLNKEICKRCIAEKWGCWDVAYEVVWKLRSMIICPPSVNPNLFFWPCHDEPPENCPYIVEHTVSMQEGGSDDAIRHCLC